MNPFLMSLLFMGALLVGGLVICVVEGLIDYALHGDDKYLSDKEVTRMLAADGWIFRDRGGTPRVAWNGMWESDYNKMMAQVNACDTYDGKRAIIESYFN